MNNGLPLWWKKKWTSTGSEQRIVQRSASFTPVEQERMNEKRHTYKFSPSPIATCHGWTLRWLSILWSSYQESSPWYKSYKNSIRNLNEKSSQRRKILTNRCKLHQNSLWFRLDFEHSPGSTYKPISWSTKNKRKRKTKISTGWTLFLYGEKIKANELMGILKVHFFRQLCWLFLYLFFALAGIPARERIPKIFLDSNKERWLLALLPSSFLEERRE